MQKYHNLPGGEGGYKAHLKKSIDAFELLKLEGHGLHNSFSDLFVMPEAETSNEIIFGKAYGPNGDNPTLSHNFGRDSEGSYALTRQMVDLFLYSDGLPREKTTLKIPNETSFNHVIGKQLDGVSDVTDSKGKVIGTRDPRLAMTIWTINDPLEDDAFLGWLGTGKGKYQPFDPQRPFAYPIKKAFVGSLWTSIKEYSDNMIIRYAEMLISYAEALYEYNGSISDAQLDETVNALRKRVHFDANLTNSFVTANGLNMLEEIRRERTVELMAEGKRYNDIIRWKIAENVLPKAILGAKFVDGEGLPSTTRPSVADRLTNAQGEVGGVKVCDEADIYVIELPSTRTFKPERDYFYPIPTFEMAQSDGNIKQNPNW
jgi:hypothetical protein